MSQKYIARPGEKVTIEIESEAPSPKPRVQSPKGLVFSLRAEDYQARRSSSIYLNFYDCGQFTEDGGETWQEFDYYVSKPLNLDANGYIIDLPQLTAEDWTAQREIFFATPRDEWKNLFRRFDYELAERYGVDLYLGKIASLGSQTIDDSKYFAVGRNASRPYTQYGKSGNLISNSQWTPQGLRLPAKQTVQELTLFTQSGFINLLDFGFGANYKITTADNYAAPAAEFILDASTDFYLVPMMNVDYGSAAPGTLNLLYAPLPRSFFIDGDGWNPSEWQYSPFVREKTTASVARSARTDQLVNYQRTRPASRLYDEPEGFVSPLLFPLSAASMTTTSGVNSSQFRTRITEGALIAMAKKKGVWFYFWANANRHNANRTVGFLPATQEFILNIS